MELLAIGLFCAALVMCGALGISVLYGLAVGLVIFCAYAALKGNGAKAIAYMILDGIKTAKSVLIVFILIGMLTGLWRASGTIPSLVSLAASCFAPQAVIITAFLANCLVSFLIGTAFGTAATMGTVCAMIGTAMGADPLVMGGAIISGCCFGDRCSPVSGSALLTAELTETTVSGNIPGMLKTAAVPFALTCIFYGILGAQGTGSSGAAEISNSISLGFNANPVVLLPAVIVIALSLLKAGAKITLAVSSAVALVVCVAVQGMEPVESLQAMALGFIPAGDQAPVLAGGGVVSMVSPGVIVCLSSAYAGIFAGTGMLRGFQDKLVRLSGKITKFGTCLLVSVATSAVACNQTLAIMLTHQLYGPQQDDKTVLAMELEDSVVIVAPLIPWSIAATVPLGVIGAPASALLFAVFLPLVALCHLVMSFWGQSPKRHSWELQKQERTLQ